MTQRRARTDQRRVVKVEQEKKPLPIYSIIAVLSFFGLLDATFLVVEYLAGRTDICSAGSFLNCQEVLGSEYAKISGFPVSGLGALAYFTVFSLATLAAYGYGFAKSTLPIVISMMFLVTLGLVYIMFFAIGKGCVYCLISAGITTLMTATIWFATYRKLV